VTPKKQVNDDMYIKYSRFGTKSTKKNTVPQNLILNFDYVNSLCGAAPDLNKFVHFNKHTYYLLGEMRWHAVSICAKNI
jgi:hypothetical protein